MPSTIGSSTSTGRSNMSGTRHIPARLLQEQERGRTSSNGCRIQHFYKVTRMTMGPHRSRRGSTSKGLPNRSGFPGSRS
jgi:hypothetical protein